MSRYYDAMRASVEARRGRVVKFIGDGVMAVFGVPEAGEDDARRAIEAADAMLDAFAGLGLDDVALRIGVNTGEVVVDPDDDDVVGDAVNVAARLEAAAPAGAVLVGEETYRLTRDGAEFDEELSLAVKGRTEAVRARRLVSLSASVTGPTMPFVGRAEELAVLVGAFHETVGASAAQLVTVVGSPGVGKSRLVGELLAAVEGDAWVLVGRTDGPGGPTFAPVADIVAQAASVPGSLHALLAGDPDREQVAAKVGFLLGNGEPVTTEEVFWGVRRVLEAAARVRPLLVMLDDVHWAQPLVLDLVEHLAQWLRSSPVLLVVTGRPELREVRPALCETGAGARPNAVLALDGLDAAASTELTAGLLGTGELPPELAERVAAATAGNPLFVRELVRMLVDDGVLRPDGDAWMPVVDIGAVDVPPTIQSLLAARIDRLAPDERMVLERAAVIGHEVYLGALAELLPVDVRARLAAVLEALRQKELLEPVGSYWIDEPVFRFHHALIRDAAYRRLLKEARADLHERVAAWVDAKTESSAEHDEVVGGHFELAHSYRRALGPLDERGVAVAAEAASRLGTAARRALDYDDLGAAASLADRAIACLDQGDPVRSELLVVRCEALLSTGNVTAARPAVAELAEAVALGGSERLSEWASCFDVQLAAMTGAVDTTDAERRIVAAAERLSALDEPAGAAKAHRVHASILASQGRVGDCEAALDRALTAAREAGDRRQITGVLGDAPLAALWGPSPVPRAGGRCLDVVRLLRITTGALAVEAVSARCQAVLEALRGRIDTARALLDTARATVEELGLGHARFQVELFAGLVELIAGEPKAADEHLSAAYDGFRDLGVGVDAAQAAALRARAALALGRDGDAAELAGEAERLSGNDLMTATSWRTVKAEALARRGEHDAAAALAREAQARAETTDALLDHADACASLAAVLELAGDAPGAREVRRRADELYQQKGATALLRTVPAAAPAEPSASDLVNAATRSFERRMAGVASGDWEGVRATLASNIHWEDRRAGLQNVLAGRDEVVANLQASGTWQVEAHPIAIRGERLVLQRLVVRAAGFDITFVSTTELDEDGLATRVVHYELEDLPEAVFDLTMSYADGEGATHAAALLAVASSIRAAHTLDREAARGFYAADVVLVDHSALRLGETRGFEELAAFVESLGSPRDRGMAAVIRTFLAIADRAQLIESSDVEIRSGQEQRRSLRLFVHGESGIERVEYFEVDDEDAARRRFREVTDVADELDNEALAVRRRSLEAFRRGDVETVLGLAADDVVVEDRRQGMIGVLHGRDQWRPQVEFIRAQTFEVTYRPIAIRGQRLALSHDRYVSDDGLLVEMLQLDELGPSGLGQRLIAFDVDDLDGAFSELDERYIQGEGAAHADLMRWGGRALAGFGTGEGLDAGIVMVNHRHAGYGEVRGVGASIELHHALLELAPDLRLICRRVLDASGSVGLFDIAAVSAGGDDGDLELRSLTVVVAGNAGITRLEQWEPNDLEAARRRYEELVGAVVDEVENAASRTERARTDDFLRGDFGSVVATMRDDYEFEDRRTGMQNTARGRDENRRQMEVIRPLIHDVSLRTLAIRGERLALMASTFVTEDGLQMDVLQVVEIDDAGAAWHIIVFDADDVDSAVAEMETRYIAGEGAEHAAILRAGSAVLTDLSGGSGLDEDIVYVDQTLVGLGEVRGIDAVGRAQSQLTQVLPDLHLVCRQVLDCRRDVGLFDVRHIDPKSEGPIELGWITVAVFGERGIGRVEMWSPDDLEAARRRFEELATQPEQASADADGPALATVRAYHRALASGDVDGVLALVDPNVVYVDHRPVVGFRHEGIDAARRIVASSVSLGLHFDITGVVDHREPHSVLVRLAPRTSTDEVELTPFLALYEIGADNRAVAVTTYDATDVERARRRLVMGLGSMDPDGTGTTAENEEGPGR